MALGRDIRLTERQLWHGERAVARRVKELEKRLDRTSYAGKPGMLNSVRDELGELRELQRVFKHNHQQIGRQLAASILGADHPEARN